MEEGFCDAKYNPAIIYLTLTFLASALLYLQVYKAIRNISYFEFIIQNSIGKNQAPVSGKMGKLSEKTTAGDRNRTDISCLGSTCSTTELRPRKSLFCRHIYIFCRVCQAENGSPIRKYRSSWLGLSDFKVPDCRLVTESPTWFYPHRNHAPGTSRTCPGPWRH